MLVDDKDKEGKELWTSMFVLVLEDLLEEDLLLREKKQFRENKTGFFLREMTSLDKLQNILLLTEEYDLVVRDWQFQSY